MAFAADKIRQATAGTGGFEIDQSLRFDDDGEARLIRTPTSNGDRRTCTLSVWVKRGNHTLGVDQQQAIFGAFYASSGSRYSYIAFADNDTIIIFGGEYSTSSTPQSFHRRTKAVYRDSSAWYHIVWRHDSTDGTAANRDRLYVNGVLQDWDTSLGADLVVGQNEDSFFNYTTSPMDIGEYASTNTTSTMEFDGYMAEMHWIDGTSVAATSFGETGDYGEWKPIKYSGSYGTNGFYLPFKQDYSVEGFSVVKWKGDGINDPNGRYIGGVGFTPDVAWIKNRSGTANHVLTINPMSYNKHLNPNLTNEQTSATDRIEGWEPDGFKIGHQSHVNASNETYVGWNWDMGGTDATFSAGSITSSGRANATYGQSVVFYTGAGTSGNTVGHGLSSAPELVISKSRTSQSSEMNWTVYHVSLGNTKKIYLNTTAGSATSSNWGNTTPTSSVFTVNPANGGTNTSGESYAALCFHSVTGYSKFGTYTGNGSTTGPVVTTGFAPAFVMYKRTDSNGSWRIHDNVRFSSGTSSGTMVAEDSQAETSSGNEINFLATGFQPVSTNGDTNASSATYIYAAFADKREYAFWLDQSGNNNDWTSNNLTESDISVDSPTNNFATWNPLVKEIVGTVVLSEGNLRASASSNSGYTESTIAITSGKYYMEIYCETLATADTDGIGFTDVPGGGAGTNDQNSGIYYRSNGTFYVDASLENTYATFETGDIISMAINADDGAVYFYKNNVLIASRTSLSYDKYLPYLYNRAASSTDALVVNFGQDSSFAGKRPAQGNGGAGEDFYYTPPTGFKALCTKNLPAVAVIPSEYFNSVLYTGDGNSTHAITGVGFRPDFLWIKNRSDGAGHTLQDVLRTPDATIYSQTSEGENATRQYVYSFDSDGFTTGNAAGAHKGPSNHSGNNYVGWNWKAGGSGSSNTNGGLTSQVSASTDAGFSIVTFTGNGSGNTVGHGLSKAPEMVITKGRNFGDNWHTQVYPSIVATKTLQLDSTGAETTSNAFNDTAPTSSVFSISTGYASNTRTIVAYCFHSVDGYSKVGTYTGNAAADGTFVYTGFRPAFIMIKNASASATYWHILDSKRPGYNVVGNMLFPNSSDDEDVYTATTDPLFDIVSNGFKLRGQYSHINGNGNTHIYLAFAETPFKYSNAR